MYIVFIVLILIASILIVLSVLVQNPKGGMAANFGASNQVLGARQTSNKLEKFTWGLALAILILSVGATMFMPKTKIEASKSGVERAIEQSAQTNSLMLPNQAALPGITGAESSDTDTPAEDTESEPAE